MSLSSSEGKPFKLMIRCKERERERERERGEEGRKGEIPKGCIEEKVYLKPTHMYPYVNQITFFLLFF